MGHFFFFCIFFMFTNIGIPDIERRMRKRNLLIGQPQGSLSERIDTQCAFVDLKITFSFSYVRIIDIIPLDATTFELL